MKTSEIWLIRQEMNTALFAVSPLSHAKSICRKSAVSKGVSVALKQEDLLKHLGHISLHLIKRWMFCFTSLYQLARVRNGLMSCVTVHCHAHCFSKQFRIFSLVSFVHLLSKIQQHDSSLELWIPRQAEIKCWSLSWPRWSVKISLCAISHFKTLFFHHFLETIDHY